MSSIEGTENYSLLYEENSKVACEFWEWRHKIMTRYFAAVTAMMIMAGWFYERPELKKWLFIPFLLGSLFSVISDLMDKVNTKVLRSCYRIGMELEQKISSDGGIFKAIESMHYRKISYHIILRFMYLSSAVLFLIIAIGAIIFVK